METGQRNRDRNQGQRYAEDVLYDLVCVARYIARRAAGAPMDGRLSEIDAAFRCLARDLPLVDAQTLSRYGRGYLDRRVLDYAALAESWIVILHRADDVVIRATPFLYQIAAQFTAHAPTVDTRLTAEHVHAIEQSLVSSSPPESRLP